MQGVDVIDAYNLTSLQRRVDERSEEIWFRSGNCTGRRYFDFLGVWRSRKRTPRAADVSVIELILARSNAFCRRLPYLACASQKIEQENRRQTKK